MSRPSFYLIDGHAHIFRSYFAPFRALTSPDGRPVKAPFVFAQMLINIAETRKPDYYACVLDHGDESTFRRKLYPEYKAHRTPPPDDFFPQQQIIFDVLRDSGLPIFEAPGFEADDILATFVHALRDRFDIYLVSRDKDLRQLLGPGVYMLDVQNNDVIDEEKMRAKLGYGPEQSVEIQTLIGDATDNVPGIPGVGEKTAADLLARFGTIDNVYNNLDQLKSKKKLVENLLAHRSVLDLSRTLVTLRSDVPIDTAPDRCRFKGFNLDSLRPRLRSLGFTSLDARLGSVETNTTRSTPRPSVTRDDPPSLFSQLDPSDAASPTHPQASLDLRAPKTNAIAAAEERPEPTNSRGLPYEIVDSIEALDRLIDDLRRAKRFAFDTETTGLRPTQADLVGLSFAWREGHGVYVPVRGPMGSRTLDESLVIEKLRPILEDPSIEKFGHNIKFDLLVMRRAGVRLGGVSGDTMLLAFLLDASMSGYGIDALALRHLNFKKVPTSDLIGTGKKQTSMDMVDIASVGHYAAEDVDVCLRLDQLLRPRLEALPELHALYRDLELPVMLSLVEMEWNGIRVDPAVLREQSGVLAHRIERLHDELMQSAGTQFNPDSPKQLADVLFNRLQLSPLKKTKTGYSTDVEVLEKLADEHPVPKLILAYRSLVKLKNTYLDTLATEINPSTGRIHSSFNITGAATGRLSSSDPNLQNIPIRTDEGRRIRLAFVADTGNTLLSADYSQIELRILAHLSGEAALTRAFENDEDIHSAVASEVFGVPLAEVTRDQRARAKVINFGIIYGITAVGLARRIEGVSVPEAQRFIDDYNRRFPGVARFMRECVEFARQHGYVQTILGRRRPLPDIHAGVISIRNMNERMAINSVVQGSAADLIKRAMINLQARITRETLPARMLLQVHDELVLEAPIGAVEDLSQVIRAEMEGAMKLNVPLKVEIGIGPNWAETK